jgi:hypothetical protein
MIYFYATGLSALLFTGLDSFGPMGPHKRPASGSAKLKSANKGKRGSPSEFKHRTINF